MEISSIFTSFLSAQSETRFQGFDGTDAEKREEEGWGGKKEGRERKRGREEKESESKDSNRSQATTPNNWRVNLKNDRITEHLCANTHQALGFRSGVVA